MELAQPIVHYRSAKKKRAHTLEVITSDQPVPDANAAERASLIESLLALSVGDDGRVIGGAAPSGALADLLAGDLIVPDETDYRQRARLAFELIDGANGNVACLLPAMPLLTALAADGLYALSAKRL